MTVEQFLAWAEGRPGRWELYNGVPIAMAAERTRHFKVKFKVQSALEAAIIRAGIGCHMLPDGATVRISPHTAFEPDALVYCGPELPGDALVVPDPVIVAEVLSPSTQSVDTSRKVVGYFSVPSVQHYLIIDPDAPPVVHYRRQPGGAILTQLVHQGEIVLDPPGLTIDVDGVGIGR